ncbi:hypothetical protein ACFVUS_06260 [Nocardia sp. NPDC058058]|uniref:hypothetical protein n=1 Tax=Nocardia sp. NPDC058058 TaxID=3346317 RepID=UPI0036DDE2A3
MYISHEPPDYPIMNLAVAQRGQLAHQACDTETCAAKAYFDKVALRLSRELRTVRSSHGTGDIRGSWNIWTSRSF